MPLPVPPVLAEAAEAANGSLVLAGVLLSLVVIYIASKLGGELSKLVDLPPVLGELIGGVLVGVSALHFLVFLKPVPSLPILSSSPC
jgi:Kef-type K+ transport system membrane component KefB